MHKHAIISVCVAGAATFLVACKQTVTLGTLILVVLCLVLFSHIQALLLRASRGMRRSGVPVLSSAGICTAIIGNFLAFYSYVTGTYWLSLVASLAIVLGFAAAGLGLPSLIWREFQEGAMTQ